MKVKTKLSYKYELLANAASTTLPSPTNEISIGKYIITNNRLFLQE